MLSDLDLLRRLVSIDSTSAKSNLRIAHEIAAYLDGKAAHIAMLAAPAEQKANLLVRFGPEASDDRGLILSGHMDAVPAGENDWRSDPFTLTEQGDRYVGRGTADMKGFLAVAANAAASVDSSTLRAPLFLLFTYDEEIGTLGAKHFAESWPRDRPLPKNCIIGEPTSLTPRRAHKGHLKVRITTTGKAAHSGYPHLGENAIEKAAPILAELARFRRELEAQRSAADLFPDAPYVPLNIGTVHGGRAVNIVPDRCEIEVGIRLLPGMNSDEIIARLKRLPDADCEVMSNSPPMLLDASSTIFSTLAGLTAPAPSPSVSFATDAGWLQTMGIDCALLGPGSIEDAHRANEFVPKDDLHRAGPLLRDIIARFCT
jgi:acetylornithine deacetylase